MRAEVRVKVVPRSSRQRIEVQADGTLKAWVHAAPVDGQANEAVCALLAKALAVPIGAVEIVNGESARSKRVSIAGIELTELLNRLS